jgi:hypothetical protein
LRDHSLCLRDIRERHFQPCVQFRHTSRKGILRTFKRSASEEQAILRQRKPRIFDVVLSTRRHTCEPNRRLHVVHNALPQAKFNYLFRQESVSVLLIVRNIPFLEVGPFCIRFGMAARRRGASFILCLGHRSTMMVSENEFLRRLASVGHLLASIAGYRVKPRDSLGPS